MRSSVATRVGCREWGHSAATTLGCGYVTSCGAAAVRQRLDCSGQTALPAVGRGRWQPPTATLTRMVSIEEATQMAMALPEVVEGTKWGHRTWSVAGKEFAWERPFSKADIKRLLPASPPAGSIIAIATEDLGEKKAILAANHPGFFDIAHFDGFAAFLVQLDAADPVVVQEALIDAWLCSAPPNLADTYLEPLQGCLDRRGVIRGVD